MCGKLKKKKKKIGAHFNFLTCLITTHGLIIHLLTFTSGHGFVLSWALYMEVGDGEHECGSQQQWSNIVSLLLSPPVFSSLRRTSSLLITPIRAPCDAQGLVGSARSKGGFFIEEREATEQSDQQQQAASHFRDIQMRWQKKNHLDFHFFSVFFLPPSLFSSLLLPYTPSPRPFWLPAWNTEDGERSKPWRRCNNNNRI